MATTIFSTVGAAEGGQLGAAAGSLAGGLIDTALNAPSAAALRVQSAAYGEAIPRLYGTIRVAGGILWSTGLKEEGAGLTKLAGSSGRTYSTSLAIGISARAIVRVGRIWADGKLIRDTGGDMSVAGGVRVYTGKEDQVADPLIVALEGAAGAPAYRGLAYVVFENLQLSDFANRVPQFGFEVFADAVVPTVAAIACDLFAAAGAAAPDAGDLTGTLDGYGVGGGATLGGALGQLALLQPHDPVATGAKLRLRAPGGTVTAVLSEANTGAFAGTRHGATRTWRNAATQRAAELIEIGYFDPARDYQAGQQRASAARATRTTRHYDLPAAIGAAAARALAERLARDGEAARSARSLALTYANLSIEVGDRICVDDDARQWRVRRQTLDGMVVELELEALAGPLVGPTNADAGRAIPNVFSKQGATQVRLLDLPAFNDDGGAVPRLWMAVSGDGAWRAADILASTDGGASWVSLGSARTRAVTGTTLGVLADGPADRWDERTTVEVMLANADDWLTSATMDAVVGGANLAAIGDELVAFRAADATGPGRFRLSGLLRGRFGTEFASTRHGNGEAFTLLDPARLFRADLGSVPVGATVMVKAVGPLDVATQVEAKSICASAANLRPFTPTHLRMTRDPDGTVRLVWSRRSRIGSGWPDGSDIPLGEANEEYLVTVVPASGPVQTYTTTAEALTFNVAQQTAQTGAPIASARLSVAQVSALAGPGPAASVDF